MIVGTAGHIDHGKTSLVKALTGVDTDRLKEEKARGITIDLGFAYVPLPGGDVLGFVDVPGHERFVHTMLAGAAGIDFVMLIVAADDGVMPQTREHLQIVDLLGISDGVIVLTKADLAEPERLEAVEAEIRAAVAGTALAAADILRVSAVTGEGIDRLRERLFEEAESRPERQAGGRFRFSVDRSFTLPGAGTIVTGVVVSGAIGVGDQVVVLPQRLAARVRSLHAQNRPAERALAGERCAINLAGSGISKEAVGRGDWIQHAGDDRTTQRLDAEIRLLPSEKIAIRQWMPVHFHHGASDLSGRVVLLSGDALAPGETGLVQIVLDKPVAARQGDRIVLRDTSAQRTIAGGRILDARPPERRRRSPERLATLDALRSTGAGDALAKLLALSPGLVDFTAFAADRGLTPAEAESLLARLSLLKVPAGLVQYVVTAPVWNGLRTDIERLLADFHAANPELPGLAGEKLRLTLLPRLPRDMFVGVIQLLAQMGIVALQAQWVRLPTHRAKLGAEDVRLWNSIKPHILRDRFKPPRVRDFAGTLATPEASVRRACKALVRTGELIEVAHDHFFLRETVGEMAAIARDLSKSGTGEFAAADFRNRLDNGRKVAIQILEYFDRQGLTLRRGDLRRVVRDPARFFDLPAQSG